MGKVSDTCGVEVGPCLLAELGVGFVLSSQTTLLPSATFLSVHAMLLYRSFAEHFPVTA